MNSFFMNFFDESFLVGGQKSIFIGVLSVCFIMIPLLIYSPVKRIKTFFKISKKVLLEKWALNSHIYFAILATPLVFIHSNFLWKNIAGLTQICFLLASSTGFWGAFIHPLLKSSSGFTYKISSYWYAWHLFYSFFMFLFLLMHLYIVYVF